MTFNGKKNIINKNTWISYASKKLSPQNSVTLKNKKSIQTPSNENYHKQVLPHNLLAEQIHDFSSHTSHINNIIESNSNNKNTVHASSFASDQNFFNNPSAITSIDEAKREATLLFSHCLDIDKVKMHINNEFTITSEQEQFLEKSLQRRINGEPLAYILGKKEFFSLDFKVNKHTLIPRPETEQLVEIMLEESHVITHKDQSNKNQAHRNQDIKSLTPPLYILDLGCGTGCISLSFLKNHPHAEAFLCDISAQTIEVAKENTSKHNLQEKTTFLLADFTTENFYYLLQEKLAQKEIVPPLFDIIVSNPPYIPYIEYEKLHTSVKDFEPHIALVSSDVNIVHTSDTFNNLKDTSQNLACIQDNALFHIASVIRIAEKFLKPHGLLLIEHGYNQAENVRSLCKAEHFLNTSTVVDFTQTQRFLKAIKK